MIVQMRVPNAFQAVISPVTLSMAIAISPIARILLHVPQVQPVSPLKTKARHVCQIVIPVMIVAQGTPVLLEAHVCQAAHKTPVPTI
jgi:hypothetical protein